jgi:hypothetical protein
MATALRLPFAHLNLRWNPFGEPGPADWAALAVAELPELRPRDPVQFLGDCGRGKTTHLRALRARHPGAFYDRLEEGQDRCQTIPTDGVFLLDEAQWLRPALLRRLVASEVALALGTHDDLTDSVGHPLRTVHVGAADVGRLRAIVERRIEWARRGPGDVPVIPDHVLAQLTAAHGSNLRATLWTLYDAVQRMEAPGHVEV